MTVECEFGIYLHYHLKRKDNLFTWKSYMGYRNLMTCCLVKWKCYLLDASIYVYSLHFIHSQFACCMSKWGSLNIFQEFALNLSQFSRFFFVFVCVRVVVFVSPSFLISFCFSLKSGKLTIFCSNLSSEQTTSQSYALSILYLGETRNFTFPSNICQC